MIIQRRGGGLSGIIFSLILVGIILMVAFYSIKGLYSILTIFAPMLIIAAAIIKYSVILDYGKMVIDKLKNSFVTGLLYILGSIVFYPILFGFLLYKALKSKKGQKKEQKSKRRPRREYGAGEEKKVPGEYINYEEMDNSPLDFDKMREQKKSLEELLKEKKSES